jgi:[ribosomal protein S5]-alanine N-acetyltransferase
LNSHRSTVVLETERLILRHLRLDDLGPLAAIQSDAEVMRYMPSGPLTWEQTAHNLDRCIALQAEHGFSLWGAVEKVDGRLIGRCGLLPHSLQGRDEVEIAYLIARSDWSRGLATEAALALRDHGFDSLGLDRLVSIIHRDNMASRKVAEKAGLRPERMIQYLNHRCWLYAINDRDRGKS